MAVELGWDEDRTAAEVASLDEIVTRELAALSLATVSPATGGADGDGHSRSASEPARARHEQHPGEDSAVEVTT
jgi:hypothetical protein